MDRVNDEGVRENIHNDYLGSVRELINSDGSVQWKRGYYPFGAEHYAEGLGNGYKFTGKKCDDEMGIDYSWHRYYSPGGGRFTQVDPLWQKYPSLSPYNYCANNPLVFVDPDGKDPIFIAIVQAEYLVASAISADIKVRTSLGALKVAEKLGGIHNGKADAWRHTTWSKESSEAVGKGWTMVFGVSHEIENIKDYNSKQMTLTQLFKEVVMDLTNNKIGRSLAGTKSDLEELASDGTLETINPENDAEYKSVNKDEEEE